MVYIYTNCHKKCCPLKEFKGVIEHKGYNYYVVVPEEISTSFQQKGYIPVRGSVNNVLFKGTLAPRKPNRHVLYLHAEIRANALLNIDDTIEVSIEYDPESRNIAIPDDVELILKEDPRNWELFLKLSDARRNSFLKYILEVKSPEARLRRIERLIFRLTE